jgi:uncharacterized protein YjbI with pentapeptide repeats
LDIYSNWNGYIKLYTEVESNFRVGDTVYITYTEPILSPDAFSLENPSVPYEKYFVGYKVLYSNIYKNEIVIDRYYNDITYGKKLSDQFLSKVSVEGDIGGIRDFISGILDGVVLYDCDIHSAVTFTQGVFKYCNISGQTFNDKYSDIRTVATSDTYTSKFTSNNVSQTTTFLTTNNIFYNRIENCDLYDCNVKNGRFVNCNFYGSIHNNYINNGFFSGCSFSGYTINNGRFYNCVVNENNLWENGYWDNLNGTVDFRAAWHNGVWNSGRFASVFGWTGGTFNSGSFESPAIWYNGIANGGIFSGITWWSGLVRNASFYNSVFNGGVFNNGTMNNTVIEGGIFNGGKINNSSIIYAYYNPIIFNGGYLSGGTLNGSSSSMPRIEIRGTEILATRVGDVDVYNTKTTLADLTDAKIYGGTFFKCKIEGGNIYGGIFYDLSGYTISAEFNIHNGTFFYSTFVNPSTIVFNGNFTRCVSHNITWNSGIYSDGKMYGGVWNDGYWNDGYMTGTTWNDGHFYGGWFWCVPPTSNFFKGGTFHYGYLNGVYYTQLPKPKIFYELEQTTMVYSS